MNTIQFGLGRVQDVNETIHIFTCLPEGCPLNSNGHIIYGWDKLLTADTKS